MWTRLETQERGIGLLVKEPFAFDGELPIRDLHVQRPGGTDRVLGVIIEALRGFHTEFDFAVRWKVWYLAWVTRTRPSGWGWEPAPSSNDFIWVSFGAG